MEQEPSGGMATLICGRHERGGWPSNSVNPGGAIICPNFQWGSTIVISQEAALHNLLLSAIPVIVVTVQDPAVTEQKAREFGAIVFHHEPVKEDELIVTIRGVLDTQE